MIFAPCLPSASLSPVCSGCQWVLISVWAFAGAQFPLREFQHLGAVGLEATIDEHEPGCILQCQQVGARAADPQHAIGQRFRGEWLAAPRGRGWKNRPARHPAASRSCG